MKISLVIPLYNEEKILGETMDAVSAYMKNTYGDDYEVIYVSDGSIDQSEEILHQKQDEMTKIISYHPNRGKGYAVRLGMLKASGDVVIFTDCDLAYGLNVVDEMLSVFGEHPEYDVIIGSRAKHPEGYAGYTWSRKLVSKTYLKVLSVFGGLGLSDSQSGIKGFRNQMAKKVFSHAEVDRFAFDFEAILLTRKCSGAIGEHPVKIVNHRPSTIHFFRDSIRMLRDVSKIKKRLKKIKIEECGAKEEDASCEA